MVLHDLAVPGSRANLDHLVIGPGGVFVVDSKQYRGRLRLDPSGRLWHGRYLLTPTLRAVEFEADRAAQVLADPHVVVPIVAVHGAQVPWGKVITQGVPVVPARRLPACFAPSRRCWDPNGSSPWPTRLGSAFALPLDSRHLKPHDSESRSSKRRLVERLTASISGTSGALLFSDDYGSWVD
jgi:hypothetical protein